MLVSVFAWLSVCDGLVNRKVVRGSSSSMPTPRPKLEDLVNFMDTVSESCLREAHTLPLDLLFGS